MPQLDTLIFSIQVESTVVVLLVVYAIALIGYYSQLNLYRRAIDLGITRRGKLSTYFMASSKEGSMATPFTLPS